MRVRIGGKTRERDAAELREHGEAYRVGLELPAKKNKVEENVIFYNDFVGPARAIIKSWQD